MLRWRNICSLWSRAARRVFCWQWCVNSQLLAQLPFASCVVLMHYLLLKCLSPSELRVQFECFLSCFWKLTIFRPSGSELVAHLAKCLDALAKLIKNALIRCLQSMCIKQGKLVLLNHCDFILLDSFNLTFDLLTFHQKNLDGCKLEE